MATRNYGQGTIHERRPGVYTLRASVVDSVTGERRRISETFVGGKKDAARRLSELVTEHNAKGRSTDLSVADIVRDFRAVAHHADGTSTVAVNQRVPGPIEGRWVSLGAHRFTAGKTFSVTVDAAKANGNAHIDAVQVIAAP